LELNEEVHCGKNCPVPLSRFATTFDILGHDSCRRIETSQGKYLIMIGGSKEIFLKVLSEKLFIRTKRMDSQNTILIDDSPEKYVCNDSGNYLFLETWNPLDASDDFLLHSLAPWLLNVHKNCGRGQLRDFVNRERIGVFALWLKIVKWSCI
jgi:hypothetical protein